jgi:hypothetical protein
VKVDAKAVKALRQATGAGMMDAKKALMQCGGDIDKATEFLRKKGLASADKKAGRVAAEGAIGAYIHAGSRCTALPHCHVVSSKHKLLCQPEQLVAPSSSTTRQASLVVCEALSRPLSITLTCSLALQMMETVQSWVTFVLKQCIPKELKFGTSAGSLRRGWDCASSEFVCWVGGAGWACWWR